MALRILLADDSSDIRKSISVALQDYGVEIRAVTDGMDVLTIGREMNPDIILCDTVLPKKDGFTVCREIKNDALLQDIPVVLIYSGFVGLQKDKLNEARPDGTLEKPFEAEQLRTLIKKLVDKTKNQRVSEFLTFPKMGPIGAPKPQPYTIDLGHDELTEEADEVEEFAQVPLEKYSQKFENDEIEIPDYIQVNDLSGVDVVEAEDLDSKPASFESKSAFEDEDDFEIGGLELKPTLKPSHTSLQKRIEQANATAQPKTKPKANEIPREIKKEAPKEAAKPQTKTNSSLLQLDPEHLEQLLENHIKQAIEASLWKILPDIAERVIREEIERLMRESEQDV